MEGNNTLAIQLMRESCCQLGDKVTAIVPVMGGPMFLPELWTSLVKEFPEVVFAVGASLPI